MFVMTSRRVLRDHMKRCRDYAIAGGCSICCAPIDPNVRQRAITRTRYVSDISDAAALAATLPVDRDAVAQQALADLRLNYCDNTNDTSVAYALRCCDGCVRVWATLYRIVSAQRLKNKSMWNRRIPHCVSCNKLPTLDTDVESVLSSSLISLSSSSMKNNERERLYGVSDRPDNALPPPLPLFSTTDLVGVPGDERGSLTGQFVSSMEVHDADSAMILRAIYLGGEMKKPKLRKMSTL